MRLFSTEASDLPADYSIYAYPLSESWEEGTGKLSSKPPLLDGVTWERRDHRDVDKKWDIRNPSTSHSGSSSGSRNRGSGSDSGTGKLGGGAWFSGSGLPASQSFSYQSPDIEMDVTEMVEKWLDGTIENHGLVLRYTYIQL